MTAGTDLDLRDLATIARDRSAAGRAKLFALLAALLVSRWQSLPPSERTQLADLVALLWPRGASADRDRLRSDLAGRPDVPAVLSQILQPAPTGPSMSSIPPAPESRAETLVMPPAIPGEMPAKPMSPPVKKSIRITVTSQPIILKRHTAQPQVAAIDAADKTATPQAPASVPIDDWPVLSGASVPPMTNGAINAAKNGSTAKNGSAALFAGGIAAPDAPRPPMDLPPPLAPRENPHRLTPDHLTESLAEGDLARFEVMLAHLTRLRTPLLRRLLQDSGNESLAILARSIGLDSEAFERQWLGWRQQTNEMDPAARLPDRREAQRIATFFAALGDGQVDRLVQRWRTDGDRLFPGTAARP